MIERERRSGLACTRRDLVSVRSVPESTRCEFDIVCPWWAIRPNEQGKIAVRRDKMSFLFSKEGLS